MNEITLIETVYYIAVQDGRLDNREFSCYQLAAQAREDIRKLCEMTYQSSCIMTDRKQITNGN